MAYLSFATSFTKLSPEDINRHLDNPPDVLYFPIDGHPDYRVAVGNWPPSKKANINKAATNLLFGPYSGSVIRGNAMVFHKDYKGVPRTVVNQLSRMCFN
jgi:hypothetical protein